MKPSFRVLDLGEVSYLEADARQRALAEEVVAGGEDTLMLLEHPPVLTLGANFHPENLLLPAEAYRARHIEVLRTDRGGDVTYHAPGQLIAWPIFDLQKRGRDLHRYLRALEEAVARVVAGYGLAPRRFPPHTGVWIGDRKVCAIGIKVRRWTTMHGIALNCDLDLAPFSTIVPCGIAAYGVTSLANETARAVPVAEVKPRLVAAFAEVFGDGPASPNVLVD